MEGPRPPQDHEINGVFSFLNTHLRPRENWSITAEYPVAFASGNYGNMRIIKENDEVLSHAVMRPLIVKSTCGLFKVGAIGSVVTSTDHRNQGLSRQILESCVSAARDHGCDIAILWTNLYDFYRKLGFELAGSEVSLVIDRDLKLETNYKIVEGNKVDPEAIHKLFLSHTVCSLRNLDETRRYMQIPNTRMYTAWDANGAIKAFAVEGKGADLDGYIHEWAGSVSALMALFDYIRKVQKRNITIISPRHSINLIQQLKAQGIRSHEGFLGMIKILNHNNLFSKLKRYARAMGVGELVLEKQGEYYYFGSEDNIFKTDSDADLIRLIFGPQRPSEIHKFDPSTTKMFEEIFPVDMWIWGWDSI